MRKESSTLYVLYSLEILLGALERSNDKVISQLESYPAFSEYIMGYNKEKMNLQKTNKKIDNRASVIDHRGNNDSTQIKITSAKKPESCLTRFVKFMNPTSNNITDVKNFMANERTFINF